MSKINFRHGAGYAPVQYTKDTKDLWFLIIADDWRLRL